MCHWCFFVSGDFLSFFFCWRRLVSLFVFFFAAKIGEDSCFFSSGDMFYCCDDSNCKNTSSF